MLRPEPSARLPLLLALLGMAWMEVQLLPLQEGQAPTPGGKGSLSEERL